MNNSDNLPDLPSKSSFPQNPEISEQSPDFSPETDRKPWAKTENRNVELEKRLDRDLLETFLLGKSSRTKESYRRICFELLDFLGQSTLLDASLGSLKSFLEIKNYQAHESKRLRLAVLKSFFGYAVKTGYLKANVASFLPKMEAHHKISERYLTQEEVIKMIALTHELRDRVLLKVLYTAGLRLSELLSLNWEHVQEREKGDGQLLILGKGNKKRVVVLSRAVFQELLTLRQEEAKPFDPVFTSREFGNPRVSKRIIQIIVDKARLRAGILKKVTPHWLRHAHASHALDRGAPIHLVQATLGHSSVATTGKYLHARPQESSSRYLDF